MEGEGEIVGYIFYYSKLFFQDTAWCTFIHLITGGIISFLPSLAPLVALLASLSYRQQQLLCRIILSGN